MRVWKLFKELFNRWWILPILGSLFTVIYAWSLIHYIPWLIAFSSDMTIIIFLFLIGALAYYFFNKRLTASFLTFYFTLFFFVIISLITIADEFLGSDHFADDLTIPAGVEMSEPLHLDNAHRESRNDSIKSLAHPSIGFIIYINSQPGRFVYDFYAGKLPDGYVYFKVFEVTKNTPLSANQVAKNSSMHVGNPENTIFLWSSEPEFVIYEGDFSKPYAARFELWFKPTDGTREHKLCEKIYKVYGWDR